MRGIKKEFMDELRRLNVVTKYNRNFRDQNSPPYIGTINALNTKASFELFISGSFIWADTEEGQSFWETVADGRHVIKFRK